MARTKAKELKAKELKRDEALNKKKGVEDDGAAQKKKRRMGWKQKARHQIMKLSQKTKPLLPRATYARLVGEAARTATEELGVTSDVRFKRDAIEALREAGEAYLHDILEEADRWSDHAGRVTLFPKDLRQALRAEKTFDVPRFNCVMEDFAMRRIAARKAAKKAAAEATVEVAVAAD